MLLLAFGSYCYCGHLQKISHNKNFATVRNFATVKFFSLLWQFDKSHYFFTRNKIAKSNFMSNNQPLWLC